MSFSVKLWINVIFHSTMCFICVFVLRDDKLMSHYVYVYCVCLKYVYSEMTNWCCMLCTICLQWAFCFLHSLSKQIPTDRQMKNLSKVCRPMFGLYWKSLLLLTPALQIPNPDGHRGKIILLCRQPNVFLAWWIWVWKKTLTTKLFATFVGSAFEIWKMDGKNTFITVFPDYEHKLTDER